MTPSDSYLAWAQRHPRAAAELAALLTPDVPPTVGTPGSEARVQSEIRLEAPRRDCMLFRNNRGAGQIEGGQFTRFGLGNESEQMNERLKSSDLIGWKRVLIGPQHLGTVIAQFLSVEVKAPAWRLTPGDKRGTAQAAWLTLVNKDGGHGVFATGSDAL